MDKTPSVSPRCEWLWCVCMDVCVCVFDHGWLFFILCSVARTTLSHSFILLTIAKVQYKTRDTCMPSSHEAKKKKKKKKESFFPVTFSPSSRCNEIDLALFCLPFISNSTFIDGVCLYVSVYVRAEEKKKRSKKQRNKETEEGDGRRRHRQVEADHHKRERERQRECM